MAHRTKVRLSPTLDAGHQRRVQGIALGAIPALARARGRAGVAGFSISRGHRLINPDFGADDNSGEMYPLVARRIFPQEDAT
jgi:hypothetical protein